MNNCVTLVVVCALCACASAQYDEDRSARYIASEPKPTPVPILKQINRHNEDGSYTYGYEAADGSFKIETKAATGEVKGKYGYKDDTGKLRVIEYGANKYGFQPAGEGITVAPPTLVDETTNRDRDDGQRPKPQSRNQFRAPQQAPQPQQSQDYDYEESPQPAYQPPVPQYRPPAATARPAPAYRAPAQSAPRPPKPAFFSGAAPAPLDQDTFFRPEPQSQPQPQYRPAPQTQPQFRPAPQPQPQYRPAQQPQFQPAPKADFRSSQNFQGPQQFSQPNTGVQYQDFPSPNAVQNQPRFTNNGFQKNGQSFSMLDQLLKEFALPQGGAAPLHDITFGSY